MTVTGLPSTPSRNVTRQPQVSDALREPFNIDPDHTPESAFSCSKGVEIASDVAAGPYSVILEQAANGVAVRMAVPDLLAGGPEMDEMS
jgi:hypothetical protein